MIEQHRKGVETIRRYANLLWEKEEMKENVESKQDKGKGRAATVETEEEDKAPILIPSPSKQLLTRIRSAFRLIITKKPCQYFIPSQYELLPLDIETKPTSSVSTKSSISTGSLYLPDSSHPEIPIEFFNEMIS